MPPDVMQGAMNGVADRMRKLIEQAPQQLLTPDGRLSARPIHTGAVA